MWRARAGEFLGAMVPVAPLREWEAAVERLGLWFLSGKRKK